MDALINRTRQDILNLTDTLLQTKDELEAIPFFTRKKVFKSLDQLLGMDLESLSEMLLELRPIMSTMVEKMQQKRFSELDQFLMTFKFKYLDRMDVLVRLSTFYTELCPPLEKYLERKEVTEETLLRYAPRKYLTDQTYNQLQSIYETMYVE